MSILSYTEYVVYWLDLLKYLNFIPASKKILKEKLAVKFLSS